MIPALAILGYATRYGPTEEELEKELKERYSQDVRANSEKNKNIADFYQRAIKKHDGAAEDQLDAVLRGGRGDQKRLHAVDRTLYGTKEGVEARQRYEESQKQRKKVKASDKAEMKEDVKDKKDVPQAQPPVVAADPSKVSVLDSSSIVAFTAVAAVAAAAGYFAGGNRR
jgi:hypothetical protein